MNDIEKKIPCSVGIISFNSAPQIRKALESVSRCAQIILCDGGSTDGTLDIAREFGCTVIRDNPAFKNSKGKLADYSGVRNQTLDASTQDWFFFIDTDEYLSAEFMDELALVVKAGESAAYWVPRKYVIDGQIIDCASTYPNRQMRLFHKGAVGKFFRKAHERIKVLDGAAIREFKSPILVPLESAAMLKKKWVYLANLEADLTPQVSAISIIKACFFYGKISLLYAFRYVKNAIFCRGRHMPFAYEWERHVYHVNLIRALIRKKKERSMI